MRKAASSATMEPYALSLPTESRNLEQKLRWVWFYLWPLRYGGLRAFSLPMIYSSYSTPTRSRGLIEASWEQHPGFPQTTWVAVTELKLS